MKTLKVLAKALKDFSDQELHKELNRRFKKRRGNLIGYRATSYGDEYNYGGYTDYIIGQWGWNKEECKAAAEKVVVRSEHGGDVGPLFKDTLKPGGRVR